MSKERKTFSKRKVPPQQEIEQCSKVTVDLSKYGSLLSKIAINFTSKNSLTNIGGLCVDDVSYGGSKKVIVVKGKKIELENIPFNFAYVNDSLKNCREPYVLKMNPHLKIANGVTGITYNPDVEFDDFLKDCPMLKNEKGGIHIAISFGLLYEQKVKMMKFVRKRKKIRFFCYED